MIRRLLRPLSAPILALLAVVALFAAGPAARDAGIAAPGIGTADAMCDAGWFFQSEDGSGNVRYYTNNPILTIGPNLSIGSCNGAGSAIANWTKPWVFLMWSNEDTDLATMGNGSGLHSDVWEIYSNGTTKPNAGGPVGDFTPVTFNSVTVEPANNADGVHTWISGFTACGLRVNTTAIPYHIGFQTATGALPGAWGWIINRAGQTCTGAGPGSAHTVFLDRAVPTGTISTPAYSTSSTVNVSYTVADGAPSSGIAHVDAFVSPAAWGGSAAGPWWTCSSSTVVPSSSIGCSGLPEGANYFFLNETDNATNTGGSNVTTTIVDTVAPTVPAPVNPTATLYTYNTSGTVTWGASSDSGVGVSRYDVNYHWGTLSNGGCTATGDSGWQSVGLATSWVPVWGANTCFQYQVHAVDGLGNTSAGSAWSAWIIMDNVSPTVGGHLSLNNDASVASCFSPGQTFYVVDGGSSDPNPSSGWPWGGPNGMWYFYNNWVSASGWIQPNSYAYTAPAPASGTQGSYAAQIYIRDWVGSYTNDGHNQSAQLSLPYSVDNTVPTGTWLSGPAYTNTSTVNLTMGSTAGGCNGIDQFALSNNNVNWLYTAGNPSSYANWDITNAAYGGNSSQGTHTVWIAFHEKGSAATDPWGRAQVDIVYDTVAPAHAGHTFSGGSNWYATGTALAPTVYVRTGLAGSIVVQGDGSDATSGLQFLYFGGQPAPAGWTYTRGWDYTAPYTNTISWTAGASAWAGSPASQFADNAGNLSAAPSWSFVPDNTGPTGTILTLSSGASGVAQSVPSVTVTASGATDAGSGFASYSWVLSGATTAAGAGATTSAVIAEGTTTVTFTSIDNLGNPSTTVASVVIDRTAPATAFTCSTTSAVAGFGACSAGWYTTDVWIKATVTDGGSGLAASINTAHSATGYDAATSTCDTAAAGAASCIDVWALTTDTTGTVYSETTPDDAAGNAASTASQTVKHDGTVPATAFTCSTTSAVAGFGACAAWYKAATVWVKAAVSDATSGLAASINTAHSATGYDAATSTCDTAAAGAASCIDVWSHSGEGSYTDSETTPTDAAGNAAATASNTIGIDRTAPATAFTCSTTSAVAGFAACAAWYKAATVWVKATVSDAGSGLAASVNAAHSATGYDAATSTCDTAAAGAASCIDVWSHSAEGSYTDSETTPGDVAVNAASTASNTVGIDRTAPGTAFTCSTTSAVAGFGACSAGWYTATVWVKATVSDATSGLAASVTTAHTTPAGATYDAATSTCDNAVAGAASCVDVWSVSSDTTGVTVSETTPTDVAVNAAATASQSVKRDATAPSTAFTCSTTSAVAGFAACAAWYAAATVWVKATVSDATSGLAASITTAHSATGYDAATSTCDNAVAGAASCIDVWSHSVEGSYTDSETTPGDVAVNAAATASNTVGIDRTAPSAAFTCSTTSAVAGFGACSTWYTAATVWVKATVTDATSGLAASIATAHSATGYDAATSTCDNAVAGAASCIDVWSHSVEGVYTDSETTPTDAAGNAAATASNTIDLDRTAPATAWTCSTTSAVAGFGACSAGWYTATVWVKATVSDATSGLAASVTTAHTTPAGATYDAATSTCDNAVAGAASCVDVWSVSSDTTGVTVSETTPTDVAGNAASTASQSVKRDTVAPSTAFTCSTTSAVAGFGACSAGWYTATVWIKATVSDATSGLAASIAAAHSATGYDAATSTCDNAVAGDASCIDVWSLSTDSTGTAYSETTPTDAAGNAASTASQSAKRDATAPSTAFTCSTASAVAGFGACASWYAAATVWVKATVSDATSGLAASINTAHSATGYDAATSTCDTAAAGAASCIDVWSHSAEGSYTDAETTPADAAGNAAATAGNTVGIDRTAPATAFTCSTTSAVAGFAACSSWYAAATVWVKATVSDAGAGLAASITTAHSATGYDAATSTCDSAAAGAASCTDVWSHSAEGSYTDSETTPADAVANAAATASNTIGIDRAVPATAFTCSTTSAVAGFGACSAGWYTATVWIKATVSDAGAGLAASIAAAHSATGYDAATSTCDNAAAGAASCIDVWSLSTDSTGTTYSETTPTDAAGNAASTASQSVKRDATAPSTAFTCSTTSAVAGFAACSAGWYTAATVWVKATVSDATSGLAASITTAHSATGYDAATSTCDNAAAGAASCTDVWSLSADSTGTTYAETTPTDVAGNAASTASQSVKRDATAPSVAFTCSTTSAVAGFGACSAGWYTSTIWVKATVTDATSGLAAGISTAHSATGYDAATSTCDNAVAGAASCIDVWSLSTDSAGTAYSETTPTDVAGNAAATASQSAKRDATPPAAPSAAGWKNTVCSGTGYTFGTWSSAATIASCFSGGADATSGFKEYRYTTDGSTPTAVTGTSGAGPVGVSAETTTTLTVVTVDNAGNVSAPSAYAIQIDRTAPSVAFTCSTTSAVAGFGACSAGWYTATVWVKATVSDIASGLAAAVGTAHSATGYDAATSTCDTVAAGAASCIDVWSLSADSAGTSYSETTPADAAGNAASTASQSAKRDAAAPSTAFTCSTTSAVAGFGACSAGWYAVTVWVKATITDATSGLAASITTAHSATGYDAAASTCDDAVAGAASCTDVWSLSADSTGTAYSETTPDDVAGNAASTASQSAKRDATAPSTAFTCSTTSAVAGFGACSAGWYTATVWVKATVSDATSGLAASITTAHSATGYDAANSTCDTAAAGAASCIDVWSLSADSAGTAYSETTPTDAAGNAASTASQSAKRDITSPATVWTCSTTSAIAGFGACQPWYGAASVWVRAVVSDATSGLAASVNSTHSAIGYDAANSTCDTAAAGASSCTDIWLHSAEGAYTDSETSPADAAGNSSADTAASTGLDRTAPSIAFTCSTTSAVAGFGACSAGWYTSAVWVKAVVSDSGAGLAASVSAAHSAAGYDAATSTCDTVAAGAASCTDVWSRATTTTGADFTETAPADAVGNAAVSGTKTIRIDLTPPVVTITLSPVSGGGVAAGSPAWFDAMTGGIVDVVVSVSDPESGSANVVMTAAAASGWTVSGAGVGLGSAPATQRLVWSTGAADRSLAFTGYNGAGLSSGAALNLSGDSSLPSASFTSPATTDPLAYTNAATQGTVSWSRSDTGSGVSGSWVQMQTAPVPTPGTCDGASWSAYGSLSGGYGWSTTSLLDVALPEGCVRWVLSVVDAVGHQASAISGVLLVDRTAPAAAVTLDDGHGGAVSGSTRYSWLGVTMAGADTGSGMLDVRISTDAGFSWSAWSSYAAPVRSVVHLGSGSGSYDILVQTRDRAGNIGSTSSTVDAKNGITRPVLGGAALVYSSCGEADGTTAPQYNDTGTVYWPVEVPLCLVPQTRLVTEGQDVRDPGGILTGRLLTPMTSYQLLADPNNHSLTDFTYPAALVGQERTYTPASPAGGLLTFTFARETSGLSTSAPYIIVPVRVTAVIGWYNEANVLVRSESVTVQVELRLVVKNRGVSAQ